MAVVPQPTLAGFLAFLRGTVAIPADVLPDSSPVIGMAFAVAEAIVNPSLRIIGIPATDSTGAVLNASGLTIYALAVYNLGADNVFNYAQDVAIPPSTEPPIFKNSLPYFQYFRDAWNINAFVSGVIQSSNDESTGNSMVVQEAAKAFTLKDLQNLKTPWGRTYLGLAQSFGPTTWGIS